ncbi:MAG: RND transporter [Thermoanaerobaculia bacterium]
MNFLERIPYTFLIVIAIVMALLPFGNSHLLEKSRMLMAGTLRRPLDWFDLVWHLAPLLLLVAKVVAQLTRPPR